MFNATYEYETEAAAITIEDVDDPQIEEIKVVNIETGEVVFRIIEQEYE